MLFSLLRDVPCRQSTQSADGGAGASHTTISLVQLQKVLLQSISKLVNFPSIEKKHSSLEDTGILRETGSHIGLLEASQDTAMMWTHFRIGRIRKQTLHSRLVSLLWQITHPIGHSNDSSSPFRMWLSEKIDWSDDPHIQRYWFCPWFLLEFHGDAEMINQWDWKMNFGTWQGNCAGNVSGTGISFGEIWNVRLRTGDQTALARISV